MPFHDAFSFSFWLFLAMTPFLCPLMASSLAVPSISALGLPSFRAGWAPKSARGSWSLFFHCLALSSGRGSDFFFAYWRFLLRFEWTLFFFSNPGLFLSSDPFPFPGRTEFFAVWGPPVFPPVMFSFSLLFPLWFLCGTGALPTVQRAFSFFRDIFFCVSVVSLILSLVQLVWPPSLSLLTAAVAFYSRLKGSAVLPVFVSRTFCSLRESIAFFFSRASYSVPFFPSFLPSYVFS